jgi:pimeloyl-ACP methyl ester carboxylesterase
VSGLVLLNVAYSPPTPDPFSLDAVLELTTKAFGYGTFWYWKLFTAPDGAQVIDDHLESMFTLCHGAPETWLETLAKPDGAREYLEADKRQPVQAYATEERRRKWLEQFRGGGIDAPLNYYRSMVGGVQDKANAAAAPENHVVKVPHFFFAGSKDYVCRPELVNLAAGAGLLPDCTQLLVDAGHWAHLALPEEFGEGLLAWLKQKF